MDSIPTLTSIRFAAFVAVCLLAIVPAVDGFGNPHGFVGVGKQGPPILLRMSEDYDNGPTTTTTTTSTITEENKFPIVKTDEEWKELLTPDQYYILRKEGTETPGASKLNQISIDKNGELDKGTFTCAGCGHPLFLAGAKYDSGTGWPSFFQPLSGSAVELQTDYKMVVPRTECVCKLCGGHLGHVFEDGPEPTGQRYCMNGAAMEFSRDSETPELATKAAQMALEDPFKVSPAQALPSVLVNVVIGGLFFNSFMTSGKSTPIDFLTLLPATYYGFLAAKSIGKILG